VRLAEVGATVPQIAAITGYGFDSYRRIADIWLLRRTQVALGAIELWGKAKPPGSKVVSLGLARAPKAQRRPL
jgi:hypothetical protein